MISRFFKFDFQTFPLLQDMLYFVYCHFEIRILD